MYLMFFLSQVNVMSSVLSFAYFMHFSNFSILETNADISKLAMAFFIFLEFYVINLLKLKGINLIIVALQNSINIS